MNKFKDFIRQQIFPGFSALSANRKVQKIYNEKLEYGVVMPPKIKDANKFKSDIETLIKTQLERKGKLEDKAKSLLFIITLAITTATFSLNFLKDTSDKLVSPILAILSICCFVFAGIRIISAINIRMFFVSELSILHEKLNDDNEIKGKLIVSENDPKEELKDLIHNKVLNDLICTKIANLTYASFTLVRNGIILFACFFAVSIAVQFANRKEVKEPDKFLKTHLKKEAKATRKIKKPDVPMINKPSSKAAKETVQR